LNTAASFTKSITSSSLRTPMLAGTAVQITTGWGEELRPFAAPGDRTLGIALEGHRTAPCSVPYLEPMAT
jgi:hypothetical protein